MGLDLRIPLGAILSLFGLLLASYGALSDSSIYQRSLNININLWWGGVLLAGGLTLLILGRKGSAR
jgi:hypothetical protein